MRVVSFRILRLILLTRSQKNVSNENKAPALIVNICSHGSLNQKNDRNSRGCGRHSTIFDSEDSSSAHEFKLTGIGLGKEL